MTNQPDQLNLGRAYFAAAPIWNNGGTAGVRPGIPTASAPNDTLDAGVPLTQVFYYQIGQASTAGSATASRFFYSATGATGGITLTTYVNDVPRALRIYSSVNLSTVTFTLVGVDGYNQTLTWAGAGPTGNTLGNTGSYIETSAAFTDLTSASGNGSTGTTAFGITNSDSYGLPHYFANAGLGLGVWIDGATASVAPTWTAGFTPTGVSTATTGDVRGLVSLATLVLANDSRYITVGYIAPPVILTPVTDDKLHSYGATPFAG